MIVIGSDRSLSLVHNSSMSANLLFLGILCALAAEGFAGNTTEASAQYGVDVVRGSGSWEQSAVIAHQLGSCVDLRPNAAWIP